MDLTDTGLTDTGLTEMDSRDNLASHSDDAAIEDGPMLPTLPPAPVLPQSSSNEAATPMSLAPLRPDPAAHASYGVLPSKPRAGEPSPAALRAAEQRHRMKKRRRTRRIAMVVVTLGVCAVAGPPTVRWIADGFDKAGSTETELPPPADDAD